MKIVCKKNDILESINISLRAIPAKTTMPILGCIVIRANSNNIKFITNDMEMAIETIVKGRVIEDGSIAIDAKKFSDIVRKITDEEITIETNEYYMATIRYGNNEASFNCLSDEEFPDLPTVEKQNAIRISQFSLKEIILQTVFSISDNESQKIMTGELFEIEGDKLTVVALDGHRIAIRKIKLNNEYKPTKVIIPGKTLREITKILSGEVDKTVNIYFEKNHILFEFENTIVISRLIEGDYYRINQMLTGDYDTKIKCNKKNLIKESDKRPIVLNINDFNLNVKINTEGGAMSEDIEIQKEGKDIVIGFNPKFLLDVFRVIDDQEITLYMTNSKAPCFIKNDEETYDYLILPVNFSAGR